MCKRKKRGLFFEKGGFRWAVQIPTTPVKPSSPQKVLTVGELVLQRAASITGGSPLKKEN